MIDVVFVSNGVDVLPDGAKTDGVCTGEPVPEGFFAGPMLDLLRFSVRVRLWRRMVTGFVLVRPEAMLREPLGVALATPKRVPPPVRAPADGCETAA